MSWCYVERGSLKEITVLCREIKPTNKQSPEENSSGSSGSRGEMAGRASRLRRAVKTIRFPCATFSRETSCLRDLRRKSTNDNIKRNEEGNFAKANVEGATEEAESNLAKILCAICLETLTCGSTGGQAIFTAQCMHSFHFVCISSNVRHGSVTCPICRAQWTQLPRDLTPSHLLSCSQTTDPILQILDDSIANFRVHRRSSLRSARYDDDDPVEADLPSSPRLQMSLVNLPMLAGPEIFPERHHYLHTTTLHSLQYIGPSSLIPQQSPISPHVQNMLYLSVKLLQQQPTDIVLVASPNGPHLRLLKQSMALVVFSLRPADRLAIVTYSSAATRAFPLRRMASNGKRAALQVIDHLFYLGEADPMEGIKKGMKILEDRTYQNPACFILHLSDSPTIAYISRDCEVSIPIHRFHIGFGFGASNGFVMHEFEEFLLRLLGGVIRETQLRIGEDGALVRLGDLKVGEERRIPLGSAGECELLHVGYSYVEGGAEECPRTGEMMVGTEKCESGEHGRGARRLDLSLGGRNSNVERWDYLDPFMARRWAKHLHGYRF